LWHGEALGENGGQVDDEFPEALHIKVEGAVEDEKQAGTDCEQDADRDFGVDNGDGGTAVVEDDLGIFGFGDDEEHEGIGTEQGGKEESGVFGDFSDVGQEGESGNVFREFCSGEVCTRERMGIPAFIL